MFGYGSSSGLLGDLKQVLDSSRNERSTQQSKADISSSLSKMNAATVGAFNKAQEEKALARAEREAGLSLLNCFRIPSNTSFLVFSCGRRIRT